MSENSHTASKSTLSWRMLVILGLLLVVFPAISWIYLSKGFNWRKEAMSELQDFGKIRSAPVIYPNGTKLDRLEGKLCVLHLFGENPDLTPVNQRILDINEKLFEQFGTNDAFRLTMIHEGGTAEFKSYMQKKRSVDFATSVYTGGVGSWGAILNNAYELYCVRTGAQPSEAWYVLADTSGTIRRFYDAKSDEEINRMVQQIAILLPK